MTIAIEIPEPFNTFGTSAGSIRARTGKVTIRFAITASKNGE
jgi:hypothetical protein